MRFKYESEEELEAWVIGSLQPALTVLDGLLAMEASVACPYRELVEELRDKAADVLQRLDSLDALRAKQSAAGFQ